MSSSDVSARTGATLHRWRRRALWPLFVIGAVIATLFPAAAPVTAQRVPFTPVDCPIEGVAGLRMDCGYLTVAESRSNFTGKTIRLAVAIIRSPNPQPAPDPVVFLSGGPGEAAVALAPLLAEIYAPILARRDMIFIDQRGTGFSQPRLACTAAPMSLNRQFPLGRAATQERDVFVQMQVDQLVACGAALRRAGVDLRAYNSAENAADLEDLRLTLGYGPWNLFGISYGSRLALTSMQYRPETIRSAVIESVYPLQANFHTGAFATYNRALSLMFADCAADAACNAAYPNLQASFDALIPRLNAEPAQVPVINPFNGEVITYLPLTGVDFGAIVFQLMYITPVIPILPALIDATARGNYELIGTLLGALLISQSESPAIFSQGMQVAVQCNEDATFADVRDFVGARDANRRASSLAHIAPFNEAYLDICASWGLATPISSGENQPARSDVRTLLINGTYDPITPPEYATTAAQTLPRSTYIEVPRVGHAPSTSSPCLVGIIAAYIDNPDQAPDRSCVAQAAPQRFATGRVTSNRLPRVLPLIR